MPSSRKERRVVVAQFAGSHGVRGEFKLRSFTENPLNLFAYGPIATPGGDVLTPEVIRVVKPGVYLCRDAAISSPEDCERFKGAVLSVSRDLLPDTDDDDYYVEDLIGLEARTEDGEIIGTVRAVPNYGAGDIVEINGEGGLVLVPFTKDAVSEVNLSDEFIRVVLPDDDNEPEHT